MKKILHYTVAVEVDDNGQCDPPAIGEGINEGIGRVIDAGVLTPSDDTSTTLGRITVCFSHSEDEHGSRTPEIHRVLCCSALHLEDETNLSMLMDIPIGPSYSEMPYGHLIRVPLPSEADPEDPEDGWAPDVRALLARARSEWCNYVRIDADGPLLDRLPVYERTTT